MPFLICFIGIGKKAGIVCGVGGLRTFLKVSSSFKTERKNGKPLALDTFSDSSADSLEFDIDVARYGSPAL